MRAAVSALRIVRENEDQIVGAKLGFLVVKIEPARNKEEVT
jgi:hypothetical protein